MAANTDTEQSQRLEKKNQLLVLVRFKPQGMVDADSLLEGPADAVQGVVDKVESAANSVPGMSVFFKEEQEPEKKTDKEYNYFKDYKDWDAYMKKMKQELSDKLNIDNDTLVHEFDATDVEGREKEGKKLLAKINQKVAAWKGHSACFHFVGLGQGGNVANESINELCKDSSFKTDWWVQSVVYVATPSYKNHHQLNEEAAFKGQGRKYSFGNPYDLTTQVIAYFEPNDKLLSAIAEVNSNPVSIFTGKLKANLVTALGNILSIKEVSTGQSNDESIQKLKNSKDAIAGIVSESVNAIKSLVKAVPSLIDPGKLPEFDKMLSGYDAIPDQSVKRLEAFGDELKEVAKGTNLNTDRINRGKIMNFLCPLVDKLTDTLKLFTYSESTAKDLFGELIKNAGIKKVLAPGDINYATLPVDDYITKVAEMVANAEQKKSATPDNDSASAEEAIYDQSVSMIKNSKQYLSAATENGDIEVNKETTAEVRRQISDCITGLMLPMMPSKKKFYSEILKYLPLDGMNEFISKLTADKAFAPLQKFAGGILGDFDEGTPEAPGLKVSIKNFDTELDRIKGFFKKNNYTVHKDANSLYFIYNSHNIVLKKTYGPVLNVIDKETGYLDHMHNIGATNYFNLNKNGYSGNGQGGDDAVPTSVLHSK